MAGRKRKTAKAAKRKGRPSQRGVKTGSPAARKVFALTPVGRVVVQRSGKWWAIELPAFPGAYTQGKTKEEAYRNLLSLLRDLVEASASLPPKLAGQSKVRTLAVHA